ncbi:MAG: hypothetical protein IT559_07355 [Alphaproteobacteria bacterium]|nr:hypothetical protein [Alphaproteobacteria bacterium]
MTEEIPESRPYRRGGPERRAAIPQMEAFPCEFEPWLGLKVSPDMIEAIKAARRGHRILSPGAPMTMDHSPARINFDIDEKGTIKRIWCG